METLVFFGGVVFIVIAADILDRIGLSFAVRIAGDKATLVANHSLLPWRNSPTLPRLRESSNESELETGNTETLENTGNTEETQPETVEYMAASGLVEHRMIPRMSAEELSELRECHELALGLLHRCLKYYDDTKEPDNGTIPRYNKIGMKADYRGKIVDMLEYNELVSKMGNKRTFVVPEIGTCAELLKLIRTGKKRIYPIGYCERQKELQDSAVAALPEVIK